MGSYEPEPEPEPEPGGCKLGDMLGVLLGSEVCGSVRRRLFVDLLVESDGDEDGIELGASDGCGSDKADKSIV